MEDLDTIGEFLIESNETLAPAGFLGSPSLRVSPMLVLARNQVLQYSSHRNVSLLPKSSRS